MYVCPCKVLRICTSHAHSPPSQARSPQARSPQSPSSAPSSQPTARSDLPSPTRSSKRLPSQALAEVCAASASVSASACHPRSQARPILSSQLQTHSSKRSRPQLVPKVCAASASASASHPIPSHVPARPARVARGFSVRGNGTLGGRCDGAWGGEGMCGGMGCDGTMRCEEARGDVQLRGSMDSCPVRCMHEPLPRGVCFWHTSLSAGGGQDLGLVCGEVLFLATLLGELDLSWTWAETRTYCTVL